MSLCLRNELAILAKHGVMSDELAARLPADARGAWYQLTSMVSHRGDGIPTQFSYPAEVREGAKALAMAALQTADVNDPHEIAWIQFSDCGQHIRRWSRTPFEGARRCRIALTEQQ